MKTASIDATRPNVNANGAAITIARVFKSWICMWQLKTELKGHLSKRTNYLCSNNILPVAAQERKNSI